MRSHEQLMLGSALTTILEEQDRMMPVISEYQFMREVLDILVNPFGPDALMQYSRYVGELTKPLNVVSNEDRLQVLFTVPAFVQVPITTIVTANGISADGFMTSLNRDIALGGHRVNEKIANFMLGITKVPNYVEVVIKPIQVILARYGRTMVDIPALRDQPPLGVTTPVTGIPTPLQSSFSDEYDD